MRISDWSSDVCSSDLFPARWRCASVGHGLRVPKSRFPVPGVCGHEGERVPSRRRTWRSPRSEEHTSELQSLMRSSYAVFCLKKKNNNDTRTYKLARHKENG